MLIEPDRDQLTPAVARNMDCADDVESTQRVLTRGVGPDSTLLNAQLKICIVTCAPATSCAPSTKHHDHCRICTDATRRCADMFRQALTALHELAQQTPVPSRLMVTRISLH